MIEKRHRWLFSVEGDDGGELSERYATIEDVILCGACLFCGGELERSAPVGTHPNLQFCASCQDGACPGSTTPLDVEAWTLARATQAKRGQAVSGAQLKTELVAANAIVDDTLARHRSAKKAYEKLAADKDAEVERLKGIIEYNNREYTAVLAKLRYENYRKGT